MSQSNTLGRLSSAAPGLDLSSHPFEAVGLLEDVRRLASPHASLRGLRLRAAHTQQWIDGDRSLLALILHALVASALEHTHDGGVLLGCRVRGGTGDLALEVWGTGAGISRSDLQDALDLKSDNEPSVQDRASASLKIVRCLADTIGCDIRARSSRERGAVFSVEGLRRAAGAGEPMSGKANLASRLQQQRTGTLSAAGMALASEYDLLGSRNVAEVGPPYLAAHLSGVGAPRGSVDPRNSQPISYSSASAHLSGPEDKPVAVLAHQSTDRKQIGDLLRRTDRTVYEFDSYESFRCADEPGRYGCILVDMDLPGIGGGRLLESLSAHKAPVVIMAEQIDVQGLARALNAGAVGFLELPIEPETVLTVVSRALGRTPINPSSVPAGSDQLAGLTARQREVLDMVLAGLSSKIIAADLGISQRTVENHRAAIMKRSGARSLPALTRMALQSSWSEVRA